MSAPYKPPHDAVQWDCDTCGLGAWLTADAAAKGCPASHPSDCPGRLSKRPGVVRCCRLSEGECDRRCGGKPGACDTYGEGLESDGLTTRLAGRRVVQAADGSLSVELDLVGVEP